MCDPIQSIATRLRGLREALELTQEEVAASCNLPVGQYREMESGTADFSVNVLQTISRHYGISLDVLMFGEEPKMNAYFITRAGKGVSVERQKAYKYEALAAGFRDRKIDPFIVTVEPAGGPPADRAERQGDRAEHGRQSLFRFGPAARDESPRRQNGAVSGHNNVTAAW